MMMDASLPSDETKGNGLASESHAMGKCVDGTEGPDLGPNPTGLTSG